MSSLKTMKWNGKRILTGLQVLLLLFAAGSWFLGRGNAYEKVFSLEEMEVSEAAVPGEIVSVEDTSGAEGVVLSVPGLSLKKGIYQIQIDYNASGEGNMVSVSSELGVQEMFCPSLELSPSSYNAVMPLEITRAAKNVAIVVYFSGNGYLNIQKIGIYETSYGYKKRIVYALFICLLLELGYFFQHADTGRRKVMLALAGIFAVSCYPLYMDYMVVGHDLPFHLLRIDAISQGLASGSFPVRIHPVWARGQGYAVGIFYGDALLYFPALLRLFGFSIQAVYKIFLAAVNLGTVLCSYYAFRKIFADRNIGILGCLVYTLAPYRLMDVYTRASVGEYTAMMTLPLVLCGLYFLFLNGKRQGEKVQNGKPQKQKFLNRKRQRKKPQNEEQQKGKQQNEKQGVHVWKYVVMTAVGLSVLIQSHVLSSLMTGFVIILTCILLIRRVFTKAVFPGLVWTVLLTLLLNLNFIVPFLDFYQEDMIINSPDWAGSTVGTFQSGGLFPIQLFTLFQRSNGGAWSTTAGIFNEPTLGIGIMLTAGLALFVYLICVHSEECRKDRERYWGAVICMLLGSFLLYMCTCYFPWDAIASLGSLAKSIVYSLEFPWRMLAPATVLLTFVVCYAFDAAGRVLKQYAGMLLMGCLLLLAVNVGWYFYDYAFTGEPYRVYATHELNSMQMYSYDYLPAGTDPAQIEENVVYCEGIEPLEGYQKVGTTIFCQVSAGSEGGYAEFPLLYYKYYRCIDVNTSEELRISAGTNNMVRVEFPEDYSGSIQIGFREPWFWRLAEVITFLTVTGIAGTIYIGRRKHLAAGIQETSPESKDYCQE